MPLGRIAAFAAVALLLYLVREILSPFVVAGVLAYVLNPAVDVAQRRLRLPRLAAVALLYLLTVVPFIAFGILIRATFVHDTRELLIRTPDLLSNLLIQLFGSERLDLAGQTVDTRAVAERMIDSIWQGVGNPAGATQAAVRLAGTALHVFLTLVVLFYLLVDWHRLGRGLLNLVDPGQRPRVRRLAAAIDGVLGRYVRGLLFLVALMATATWLVLTFLIHLPYALPIAIATGFLEIVPIVGPIAAGGIATVVAVTHGGISTAVGVVAVYFVLRQIEDQIVMPNVLGRAVHLHPVVTIFAVLAGGVLAGVLGMLLAIPVAAVLKVLIEDAVPSERTSPASEADLPIPNLPPRPLP